MRKVVATTLSLMACSLLVGGCASTYPMGSMYTNLKMPVATTSNVEGKVMKTGTAECRSYCGMVAIGDVSLETAKKNGGITKVVHVDWEVESILGIIAKYKLTVYGE